MQVNQKSLRLSLSKFETFGWPAEIRVRADTLHTAPRKSQIFPASHFFQKQPSSVLRTVELPSSRPSHWTPRAFR